MNWLDLFLVLSAASFAFSGYRQGFVVGVLSFAGFIGGGILGLTIAPPLVEGAESGVGQTVLALGVVLVCATLGQLLASWVGAKVRDLITWQPAVAIDATLGAAVSVLAAMTMSRLTKRRRHIETSVRTCRGATVPRTRAARDHWSDTP